MTDNTSNSLNSQSKDIDSSDNYSTGWISIYRSIQNHWVWDDADYFKAWITILMKCNHKDAKVLIQGELIICDRGQSLNSLNTWTKQFGKGWTLQKVRTFFKLLEKDDMIVLEGLRKTTRLTVCKYNVYQNMQHANNTQTTHKQHSDNTQVTTNNNVNNENNVKNENNIELRKSKFASTLTPFFEKYGKPLCSEFYKYWTEPNKSNTKFKQELERTWDLSRRLETWAKNDKVFLKEPLNSNVKASGNYGPRETATVTTLDFSDNSNFKSDFRPRKSTVLEMPKRIPKE